MAYLFTADAYCDWLNSRIGDPYWYGTYFNPCTESRLNGKAKQYPTHYTAKRMPRYRADIAAGKTCGDCVGASIKGAAWSLLGTRTTKYASEGVPDKSADGMFDYYKKQGAEWGVIGTIPTNLKGIAVRYSGHVGIYVGGGYVVEWRGFDYGCVRTKLKDRKWTHWYKLPWIDYGVKQDQEKPSEDVKVLTLGCRLLKKGIKGADVKELQTLLVERMAYDIGAAGIDGDYGTNTEKAVIRLQNHCKITADGKYGENTHAAFMSIIAEMDADHEEQDEPVLTSHVLVTGNSVYVRAGASTAYKIYTVVHKGDVLPCVGTADNGWHAVEVNGKTGWITNKFTEVK